jgi:argininosuccinate lyase
MMKLWGGRFTKEAGKLVEDFHSSISFDSRLYRYDIQGSIAHARMLGRCGIITAEESAAIVRGLEQVLSDIESGEAVLDASAEDIHMNVEILLTRKIGEVGKKLHTGRSRNDQVALDMRLYVRAEIEHIQELIRELQATLVSMAENHLETIMPGYTHLQKAQPVSLAHHLTAYFWMLNRDYERLADCRRRVNILPLGAGALAGTTLPLDRFYVAELLGFAGVTENSLDAVSDRDFILEFLAALSLIMMHLSRFNEEIVLWASDEFRFIELDEEFSTGSSLMPQKKNPDMAELIRGKTGRVYGDLITLLTVMKGLPLAYNKDLQEDKEALFDAVDTVVKCLMIMKPMLATLTFNTARMRAGAGRGYTNATDLADYLVRKGVSFRTAHEVVGRVVAYAIREEKTLEQLSLEELRQFSDVFAGDVFEAIDIKRCLGERKVPGGPAPLAVREALAKAKEILAGSASRGDENSRE